MNPTTTPLTPSYPGLPRITLANDSRLVEMLELDSLNILTPAIRAGDFYTEWAWCAKDRAFMRLVKRGNEITAHVLKQGNADQELRKAVERHLHAPTPSAVSEGVQHVRRTLPQEVVHALEGTEGTAHLAPLRPELNPMEERVLIELHLLHAKRQVEAVLADARQRVETAVRAWVVARKDRVIN